MSSVKTNISIKNINKICRICLLEGDNMRSMFSKINCNEEKELNYSSLSDVLFKITSISVSDTH